MTLVSVLKRFSSLGGGGGVLRPLSLLLILSRRFSSFFGAGAGGGAFCWSMSSRAWRRACRWFFVQERQLQARVVGGMLATTKYIIFIEEQILLQRLEERQR